MSTAIILIIIRIVLLVKMLHEIFFFNRPGVAGAVLQTAL